MSYAAVAKFIVKEQHLSRTECQVFFPVVGIGYPQPLTRKGVLLLSLWVQGGRHTRLRGEAGGGILYISDEGIDTLVLYVRVYYIIPVHFQGISFQGKPITDTDHFTKSIHAHCTILYKSIATIKLDKQYFYDSRTSTCIEEVSLTISFRYLFSLLRYDF